MINQINSSDVFSKFKSYQSYQTSKKTNEIVINNSFEKTAKGLAIAGIALLCAYGIITIIKKNRVNKLEDITPPNANPDLMILDTKEKFKEIISGLVHDDYDSSKTFKANFHIHSNASDGTLHPLEILKQANNYAQKLPENEKFSFALTDHDSLDGVKEICKEIRKNPEKYKKLNFVPGIELSSKYSNPELAENPVELDFLIYGFNPENEKLSQEISRRKGYLLEKTQSLFKEINEKYPSAGFSIEKMKGISDNKQLKNVCSNGYLKALKEYITNSFKEQEIRYSEDFLQSAIMKSFNNSSIPLDANIDILSAVELTKEIGGFCALAHPGKFNFHNAGLKTDRLKFSDDIVSSFIKKGGDGIESHYMAYKPQNATWWSKIRGSFKKLNLNYLRTGGYDTHGADIANH